MWGTSLLAVPMSVFWVVWVAMMAGVGDRESFPKLDFFTFYAASSLVLDGVASTAYDPVAIWQAEAKLPGDPEMFFAWLNPPTFFFVVLPFAWLPVPTSYVLWVLFTASFAAAAVYRIAVDRWLALTASVAFPASLTNALIGHSSFLMAGGLAWGMLLLRERPLLAGMALSILAFKPQFFPLVVVALIAGRYYRAGAFMLACAASLVLLSIPVFGLEAWLNFREIVQEYESRLYDKVLPVEAMHSTSAMLLVFGVPELITRVIQVALAAACVAFVWWLWRGESAFEYKAAGLAIAMVLATPYSYTYDLTFMGLAILWLATAIHRERWRPGDQEILILGWLAPLAFLYLHVSLVPLALFGLLFVLQRHILAQQERIRGATAQRQPV